MLSLKHGVAGDEAGWGKNGLVLLPKRRQLNAAARGRRALAG